MSGRVTLADLPLELSEYIMSLAAHTWAIDDKPSVASLSRTSRAVHALVQPVLVDTVIMTPYNLSRIRAAAVSFRSTRRLIIDRLYAEKSADYTACARSFPALEMFSGTMGALLVLLSVSKPTRVVLTDRIATLDHLLGHPGLSNITHIRATITPFVSAETLGLNWSSLPFSHLMLDVKVERPAHVRALFVTRIIPKLLTLPKLERLCFRPFPEADELCSDLEAYACDAEETRLYMTMEKCGLTAYDPRTMFDDAHWLVGKPLFTRD
ncbi:hypothetical protein EXIGLDRAFT_715803 [Exidia glandulosa HHB12029]|uniref:F-box domain-containing protein n=1 Tax=Exidia glandulosa HHB12029 TaxID=1314781 RepID=A0A165QK92_EXIGL|nr:hypothetical protein EXIGLDRAFT_715803 [Exidia glandulosa HHB12029]